MRGAIKSQINGVHIYMSYHVSSQQRTLPPIHQPASMGLKSKNLGGNRTVYSVDPLPNQRAASVPLRSQSTNNNNTSRPLGRESAVAPASMIDQFFTSSAHPSVKGVAAWKDLLESEKGKFHSVSMWGELMLQKVLRETAQLPSPNPLRTAVCCMLLHRIAPLMGHAEDLMKALLREVYNAIYFSWESYLDGKFITGSGGIDEGEKSDEVVGENPYDQAAMQMTVPSAKDDPTSLKHLVSSLNHRYTYFQLLEELQSARVQVLGLPSRVVVRCMQLWRHRLLLCIFTSWHGDVVCARQRKSKILVTVDFLFKKKCRKRVGEYFSAWRAHVVERRHRNIQDHEVTQKKLQQRMGRRIQQLEKENEELRAQLAALRSAHTAGAIQITNMLSLLDNFRRVAADDYRTPPDVSELRDALAETVSLQAINDFSDFSPTSHRPTGTSAQDAPVTDPETQRQNIASLFPELLPQQPTKRRSVTAVAPEEPTVSTNQVQELEAEAAKVAAGPNRLQQLKDFLDVDPEVVAAAARTNEGASSIVDQLRFVKEAADGLDDGIVAEETPNVQVETSRAHYSDVLDWISSRTQMLVMSLQPTSQGLRRCTNFTIDFRDSIRLACLLVSLGADRSVVEDAAVITDLTERATFVLKVCRCFFAPTDSVWENVNRVEACDIAKAKGGRISKLMFAFYQKFHQLPQTVVAQPPTDAIAESLYMIGACGGTFGFKPSSASATVFDGERGPLDLSITAGSPMHRSERSVITFGDFVEESIPDTQFATWFRELAAADSDDEATNFFDVALGGSVTGSVSEKMQRRMSRLSFRNTQMSPSNSTKNRKKSRNQELTESMVRWVRQKISLQHEGRDVPAFSSMTGSDVLYCVLQQMFPKLSLNSKDPLTRLRKMQDCLVKKLQMTKISLGKDLLKKKDRFAAEDDVLVPLKELLMILFFVDQEIIVNL